MTMLYREALLRQEKSSNLSIRDICTLAGTNARVGTTEVQMNAGLNGLGMQHQRHIGEQDAVARIHHRLATNPDIGVALRCSVYGMKHWVLAWGVEGKSLKINDPAGGAYLAGQDRIEKMLAPRNWEYSLVSLKQARHLEWKTLTSLNQSNLFAEDKIFTQTNQLLEDNSIAFTIKRFELTDKESRVLVSDERVIGVCLGHKDTSGPYTVIETSERGKGYGRMLLTVSGALAPAPSSAVPGATRV
jgi:hypothetical protein